MLVRLKKWNTLRNQILIVFLVVMVIVLIVVSVLTYNQMSQLLKNNAEKQINQTAVEANGRLESLYTQISSSSKLVITNDTVQGIMRRAYQGETISFKERQHIDDIVNTIQANAEGIFSFELYTNNMNRLLPIDNGHLVSRVESKWIKLANEAGGQLVWIGDDPHNSDNVLAIRRVNLMDQGFRKGGYLLVSIYRDYFEFNDKQEAKNNNQFTILVDKDAKTIFSNYTNSPNNIIKAKDPIITLDKHDYMVTKESSLITGWTMYILTPVQALTEGIDVLRTVIIASGIVGFIIFFVSSLYLSNFISRPIIKLTDTMQQASAGLLAINPSVTTAKEIKELNSTYNQLAKETNHLIQMVYQKELTRSRSELKALQAQINPHFLFNTLDALRWSLEEKGEEELAEQVITMANLFRYTISKQGNGDWVHLKEEVKHTWEFMEIIKMRFGGHLNMQINLDPSLESVSIPKLLIQPLVENAVLHGAGNTSEPCTISVSIQPDDDSDYFQISVTDDGPGISELKLKEIQDSLQLGGMVSHKGSGMALSNVHMRLHLYYKDRLKKGLTILSEETKGTTVYFVLPKNGGEHDVEYKDNINSGR